MPQLAQFTTSSLPAIESDLQRVLRYPSPNPPSPYSTMLHYAMGWVDQDGNPTRGGTGKRIRPLLCLLVCQAVAGDDQPARSPAVAVELIHNFSLVHDDIQDESPLRHNRPTVWAIWGRAQAINAGDALFTLAHLAIPILAPDSARSTLTGTMLPLLDETCLELTQGQYLDMAFESSATAGIDDYLGMIAGKTSALIGAAAQLGAAAAGASGELQQLYRQFGRSLGMAFQVIDDILDVWGTPELTGKKEAVDIYQRKRSLPVLYGLDQSEELRSLYQSPEAFDDRAVKRVVKLLDKHHAREFAQDKANEYTRLTLEALSQTDLHGGSGEALQELVDQLLRRKG